MNRIGPDTVARFGVPWWWRTSFTPGLRAGQARHADRQRGDRLGQRVGQRPPGGDRQHRHRRYTRFSFPITGLVRPGTNALAIEVNPNNPNTMFTLDDVDWNQIPPDNNTGIQFPVQLAVDGALSASNAHVAGADTADLSRSGLTVKTDVTNSTKSPQTGDGHRDDHRRRATARAIRGRQPRDRPANTTRTVTFPAVPR